MKTYLDVAREGKNDWWRYALSLTFILFMWFFIGSIPIVVLATWITLDGDPATNLTLTGFEGVAQWLNFSATVSTFLPFFIAVPVAIRIFHGRPMRTLVTAAAKINWGRLMAGFGAWFLISSLISLTEALLYPGRYQFTFSLATLIPIVIATLLLIPFQTSAEEFFFRGYLVQWIGLKTSNILLLSLLSGLFFALPHILNPEVSVNFGLIMTSYFSIGAFAAYITLRDNGMELALGLHAANNIFASVIANYATSALPTQAIFTVQELDAVYGLVALLVGLAVFYFLFFRKTELPAPQATTSD